MLPALMFVCSECGRSFQAAGFCTEDGGALADASTDALLGTMVGSYRMARLLGKGGMGAVYMAVHPEIGSRVAVKVLSQECAAHPSLVERFFAEAKAVNVIRHESIVSVSDLARLPDQRPYIIMEYLDGAPLSAHFARWGALPLGTLARLVGQVLDALGAAHAKGIVHRDLKPDNLYVTAGGRVKVLDFGIAKLKPEQGGVSAETRTGSLMGTPQYMSPEQAQGMHVDNRSDLYSIGVILFEGATGQRPFPARNMYELLKAHVELMPPAPRLLRPDIPAALEDVLLHALQKDPNYRYQSAADFKAALERATGYLPAEAYVPITETPTASGGSAPSHGMLPTPAPGMPSPHPGSAMTPYGPPTPYQIPTPHPLQPGTYPPVVPAGPPPAQRSGAQVVLIVLACLALVFVAFFLATCGSCVGGMMSS